MLSPPVAGRAPAPYLALNADDAERLGAARGPAARRVLPWTAAPQPAGARSWPRCPGRRRPARRPPRPALRRAAGASSARARGRPCLTPPRAAPAPGRSGPARGRGLARPLAYDIVIVLVVFIVALVDRRRPDLVRAPAAGLLPGPLRPQPGRPGRPAAGRWPTWSRSSPRRTGSPPFADRAGVRPRAGHHHGHGRCSPSPSCRSRRHRRGRRPEHRPAVLPGHVVARRLQRGARRLVVAQQVLAHRRPARRRPDGELRGLHGPRR